MPAPRPPSSSPLGGRSETALAQDVACIRSWVRGAWLTWPGRLRQPLWGPPCVWLVVLFVVVGVGRAVGPWSLVLQVVDTGCLHDLLQVRFLASAEHACVEVVCWLWPCAQLPGASCQVARGRAHIQRSNHRVCGRVADWGRSMTRSCGLLASVREVVVTQSRRDRACSGTCDGTPVGSRLGVGAVSDQSVGGPCPPRQPFAAAPANRPPGEGGEAGVALGACRPASPSLGGGEIPLLGVRGPAGG